MKLNNTLSNYYPQKDRLNLHYQYIVCLDLLLKDNYTSIAQLPSMEKIVINTTSSQYVMDKKNFIPSFLALELITGQKVYLTSAKKSLAPFKIRENQAIGCKVTLHKHYMYNFLTVFNTIVLPRLRDFSGVSVKSINNVGNLSIGFTHLLFFPQLESHFEYFQNFKGINLNFVTSSNNVKKNRLLYSAFQLPLP